MPTTLLLAHTDLNNLAKFLKMMHFTALEGDLISSIFFTLAKISKNRCQFTDLSTIHIREDAQGSELAPIFGDLSQSEILSEIKPPFEKVQPLHY